MVSKFCDEVKDNEMDRVEFDWDHANVGHIADHDVTPEEAEEAILGDPLDIEFNVVEGEDRWTYIGETNEGRILWLAITLRGERVQVVTAFEPEKHWRVFLPRTRGGTAMSESKAFKSDLKIPKFASEAEEAKWWFENQDLIFNEFQKGRKGRPLRSGWGETTLCGERDSFPRDPK